MPAVPSADYDEKPAADNRCSVILSRHVEFSVRQHFRATFRETEARDRRHYADAVEATDEEDVVADARRGMPFNGVGKDAGNGALFAW